MSDFITIKVGTSKSALNLDARLGIQHIRNLVGAFYESLAAHVFEAEHWTGGEVVSLEEQDGGPSCLVPDLLRRRDSTFIEVKGGNSSSVFLPYVWQAQLYDRIRRSAVVPIWRPRVEYAVFMHGLRSGMVRTHSTGRKLVTGLAQHTVMSVLMDLDVVLKLSNWCGVSEYGSPDPASDKYYYPPFYRLTPAHVRALVQHPRCCLDWMFGRDQLRYHVKQITVGGDGSQLSWTRQLVVNDTFVAPFPCTIIRKKRHVRGRYDGPVDDSWRTRQESMFQMDGHELFFDEEPPF